MSLGVASSDYGVHKEQSWQTMLWLCFGVQVCTSISFSTVFPFLPLYIDTLPSVSGLKNSTLSAMAFSSAAITMMIASPIWGSLADRYGRKPMVVRSLFGGALSICLMGFVRTSEELIILRAIQGFLSGVIASLSALIIARVPENKTGYAMGVFQLGLWSGVSIGPFLGGIISDAFGFRVTFIGTAMLLLLSGIVVILFINEIKINQNSASDLQSPKASSWGSLLKLRGMKQVLLLRFLSSMGRTVLSPILPLFVATLMESKKGVGSTTGIIIGVSSLASTLSTYFLGSWSDSKSPHRVALLCALFSAALFIPQAFVTSQWQLMVLYAVAGIGIGGLAPTLSSLLSHISHKNDAGRVYGLDNSIGAAGRALSPFLAAVCVALFGMRSVFALTSLIFLVLGLLAATFPPQRAAQKQRHTENT